MNPCQIFAHRGANREATENTRAAFDKALNYSINGMETDVQLSRDEVPVLWHDRYTDKLGYPQQHIDDFDYVELERMNFAYNDTQPESVLSLKEFLNSYRHRCRLQIEIKNRDWELSRRHELKVTDLLELPFLMRETDSGTYEVLASELKKVGLNLTWRQPFLA